MNSLKILIALSFTVTLFSCKKSITDSQAVVAKSPDEASVAGTDCERRWFGQYVYEAGGFDTITERKFISGGVAQVPLRENGTYYSNIIYTIPLCHDISGDSVRFETSLKNSPSIGGIFNYDVNLTIQGKRNDSRVTFVASKQSQIYTALRIGNQSASNLPRLVYPFYDFTTVSLETKDLSLNVYKSDELLLNHSYRKANAIGKLKEIYISFKGSGAVDWVKLYNSNTGKLLMEEQFNVDGESNTIWYK